MLKVKDNVKLEELEKFGFVGNKYIRKLYGEIIYMVVITSKHRYLQIKHCYADSIAKTLQELIYDLTKADLIEKVVEIKE